MIELYLKANTEADLIAALPFARATDEYGIPFWLQATHDFSLDIIGTLYNQDGIFDGENCITPPTIIRGFHANLILVNEDIVIPEGIIIAPPPNNLQRLWA